MTSEERIEEPKTHGGTIEDFLRRRECGIWTAPDTDLILGHIRSVEATWKALVEEYAKWPRAES